MLVAIIIALVLLSALLALASYGERLYAEKG